MTHGEEVKFVQDVPVFAVARELYFPEGTQIHIPVGSGDGHPALARPSRKYNSRTPANPSARARELHGCRARSANACAGHSRALRLSLPPLPGFDSPILIHATWTERVCVWGGRAREKNSLSRACEAGCPRPSHTDVDLRPARGNFSPLAGRRTRDALRSWVRR